MSKNGNQTRAANQKAELWKNSSDRNNFERNIKFLQQNICGFEDLTLDNKRWVYSHIPKTGGTSFENYLAQLFLIQDILHINAPDLNQLPEVLSLKNQCPRLITGHHPLHGLLYHLLPNEKLVHITLLREPVSRVLSYYNYLKSHKTHAKHSSISHLDIDAFLQQSLVELHNGQARRLSGLLHSNEEISDLELFERAKNVVDTCFTMVGVTENIEALIQLIEYKCRVKINRSTRKNPSAISLKFEDLTISQKKAIQKNNAADMMLYNYILQKFSKLSINL